MQVALAREGRFSYFILQLVTFAFERYNGMIQAINHNSRIGELAVTFLRYFCMGSNIRAMFTRGSKLPSAFDAIKETFTQVFGSDVRGTFLNDSTVFDEASPLSNKRSRRKKGELSQSARDLFASFSKISADEYDFVPQNSIKHLGVDFHTSASSRRNSFVYFKKDQIKRAGMIGEIFTYHRQESKLHSDTLLLVHEFAELSAADCESDPYRRYEVGGGKLYSEQTSEYLLIKPSDIICHCATAPFTFERGSSDQQQCIWVLPLERSGFSSG
ncbi:hypothetical protein SISNIDRAFT_491843 [Sistotremastrum niveocremeum HHB9708]|uniref:Uncharacterized protein n=1 Tax=Sistotremastrum niveocremeum HHB9708 TaxID=1314777 RepID=A0A164MBB7_9AGAM|nr:hypothetical protein SISNIDRAFT_491843 [Sistotremastrum niveocremeum HHB9708]